MRRQASDESKTKVLRAQGRKINLSLSDYELFRKMAAAVKSNRLKPGQAIRLQQLFWDDFERDNAEEQNISILCP